MNGHSSSFPFWATRRAGGGSSPPNSFGIAGTFTTKVWPQPLAAKSSATHSSARIRSPILYLGALVERRGRRPRSPSDRPPPLSRRAVSRGSEPTPLAFARTPRRECARHFGPVQRPDAPAPAEFPTRELPEAVRGDRRGAGDRPRAGARGDRAHPGRSRRRESPRGGRRRGRRAAQRARAHGG